MKKSQITLIELMMVIAIIFIFTAIAIPNIIKVREARNKGNALDKKVIYKSSMTGTEYAR